MCQTYVIFKQKDLFFGCIHNFLAIIQFHKNTLAIAIPAYSTKIHGFPFH